MILLCVWTKNNRFNLKFDSGQILLQNRRWGYDMRFKLMTSIIFIKIQSVKLNNEKGLLTRVFEL